MAPYGRSRSSAPRTNWKEGDIAFMKPAGAFSPKDYDELIRSGYVPERATTHPVIILTAQNQKAIITTVSAYNTEQNNFLPPWQQICHRAKNPDHFRAFEGSRRPSQRHPSLRLTDPTARMPKPQASWVFIQNFFCVPFSVLGHFNKSPVLLRVHPESLAQLKADVKRFTKQYRDAGSRLSAGTPPPPPPAAAATAAAPPPAQDLRRPGPPLPAPAPARSRRPAQARSSHPTRAPEPAPSSSAPAPAGGLTPSFAAKSWSSVAAVAAGSHVPATARRAVKFH